MLSLSQVVKRTCPSHFTAIKWRSSLNRILAYDEARALMLGASHPNYPEEAVPRFLALVPLVDQGYEPAEIARRIRELNAGEAQPVNVYPVTGQPSGPSGGMDLVVQPQQVQELVRHVGDYLAVQTADLLAQRLLPPLEDCLIGAQLVADLLGCGVSGVVGFLSRHGVEPVAMRPRRWRRSDVLRLIARL